MSKIFKYYNGDLEKSWYESSNIKYSELDDADNALKTLRVVFNNGTMYQYADVDVYDYIKFRDADSQGKAFNQYIRKYECQKMDGPDVGLINEELEFRAGNGHELKNLEDGFRLYDASGAEIFRTDRKLDGDSMELVCGLLKALKIRHKII